MSNVKDIIIRGEVPFNVANNDDAAKWLGILNGPSIGIRITYGNRRFVLNGVGKTAMYRFSIEGQEAVRYEWIKKIIADFITAGGTVDYAMVRDIENDGPWESMLT